MMVTTVPLSVWTISMNGCRCAASRSFPTGRRGIRFGDSYTTISRHTLGGILQQRHIRIETLRRLGDVDALPDHHMISRAYARLYGVSHVGDQPLMDTGPLRRLFEIRVHSRKRTGHSHDPLDSALYSLRWAARPWPFLGREVPSRLRTHGGAADQGRRRADDGAATNPCEGDSDPRRDGDHFFRLHRNCDSGRLTSHSYSPAIKGTSRGYTCNVIQAALGMPRSTHCLTCCSSRSLATALP